MQSGSAAAFEKMVRGGVAAQGNAVPRQNKTGTKPFVEGLPADEAAFEIDCRVLQTAECEAEISVMRSGPDVGSGG